MRVNESAAASTKVVGATAIISRALYRMLTFKQQTDFTHPNQKEIIIFTWDDDSEIGIKRSLQKMTDNNLSALYGLNHVEIIKTSKIKDNPEQFRRFLTKHISDDKQVEVAMNQLLNQN